MKIFVMLSVLLAAHTVARGEDSPGAAAEGPIAAAEQKQERRAAASLDELKARLLDLKDLSFGGDLAALPKAPVFVEFVGSPLLSSVVAQDLRARGVQVAAAREGAAGVLTLSGRVQLDGSIGRRYFDIGETFEKIAAKDEEAARIAERSAALEAGAGARDAAMASALYQAGLFDKFLRNYFSVVSLADVMGIRGSLNTLIAGDPRGFCLTNCEHWKHIHHTMVLFAKFDAGETSWKGRVVVKAWMVQIDPQPVFDVAYEALMAERLLAGAR